MPSPESPKPLILSNKEAYWITIPEREEKKEAEYAKEAFLRNAINESGLHSIKAVIPSGKQIPVVGEIETICPTVTVKTKEGKDIKLNVVTWSNTEDVTDVKGLVVKRVDEVTGDEDFIFMYKKADPDQGIRSIGMKEITLSKFVDGEAKEINNLKKIKRAQKLINAYTKAVLAAQPPQK